jgi:hypothetical protein
MDSFKGEGGHLLNMALSLGQHGISWPEELGCFGWIGTQTGHGIIELFHDLWL